MRDDERQSGEASDAELVARARSGDEASLTALVGRHQASAYRVALSLLRDEDAAQDVVQDAFLKAFRALDGFRGDAAFRTWLLTITANEARGALRKSVRRKETAIDDAGPIASDARDPSETAVLARESARAREMLDKLPDKQRMSVTLRVDEGLSFREIGEIIGSTEGAARVNYFHGIRRLREWME